MSRIFILDLGGLGSTQALLKTRAFLEEGPPDPVALSLDREDVALDLTAFLESLGLIPRIYRRGPARLLLAREADSPEILVWHDAGGWRAETDDQEEDEEEIIDLLQPADSASAGTFGPEPSRSSQSPDDSAAEDAAVLVGSQFMGAGNDELGGRLTQNFFDSLAAPGRIPKLLAFYNTGVFLTTRESAIVEALRDLEARGATVISSGLCLDFFNLQDQLKVGRIGNMYEIINAQRRHARVLRL
ncbi:MAG: sulfurtransferase-like selenium metabolism protein YedF [Candidatus Adiutrix sp.]|nr:sulfurtransferase-like selenium metabolism protein YedF [Candidatus Adiutrix sp.]